MIKEVEIQNTLQEVDGVITSSVSSNITGRLTNSGDTLHVTCVDALKENYARVFRLDFMNINNNTNSYTQVNLGTTTPKHVWTSETEETFDLSSIKTLIKVIDTSYVTEDYQATLKFYTNGINVADIPGEGTVQFGYPYTVEGLDNITMNGSTDGWYQLLMLDLPIWDKTNSYIANTLVTVNDKFYISIQDTIIDIEITDELYWEEVTSDEFMRYVTTVGIVNDYKPPIKLLADVILSRNVKMNYILPFLKRTSFARHDDAQANKALLHLNALREAAVAYLQLGDPIHAVNTLNSCANVYDSYAKSSTTKNVQSNTRYTL